VRRWLASREPLRGRRDTHLCAGQALACVDEVLTMRAVRLSSSFIVPIALSVPLLSFGCGGADVGDDAFASGGGTPTTTTSATGAGATQASSAGSGGGGADAGAGGAADGGGSASSGEGGGSSGDGGGGTGGAGSGGTGGTGSGGTGGGESLDTCDDGCAPLEDGEADCDEDGDPNGEDCQPCDANVHHEQEDFFSEPYAPFGGGDPSFDYDCSAVDEAEYSYVPGGCDAFNPSNCPDGDTVYAGDVAPECGVSHTVEDCGLAGIVIGMCAADGPSSSVEVRCR
jgi:hypothetical protein